MGHSLFDFPLGIGRNNVPPMNLCFSTKIRNFTSRNWKIPIRSDSKLFFLVIEGFFFCHAWCLSIDYSLINDPCVWGKGGMIEDG